MGAVKLQQIRNNSKTNRTGRQLEMNPHEAFTCKCFFFFKFASQIKPDFGPKGRQRKYYKNIQICTLLVVYEFLAILFGIVGDFRHCDTRTISP